MFVTANQEKMQFWLIILSIEVLRRQLGEKLKSVAINQLFGKVFPNFQIINSWKYFDF